MNNLLPVFSHGSYDIHAEEHVNGEFYQVWKDGVIVAQRSTLEDAKAWVKAKYTPVAVDVVAHEVVGDRFDVVVTYVNGDKFVNRKQERLEVAEYYYSHLKSLYRLA